MTIDEAMALAATRGFDPIAFEYQEEATLSCKPLGPYGAEKSRLSGLLRTQAKSGGNPASGFYTSKVSLPEGVLVRVEQTKVLYPRSSSDKEVDMRVYVSQKDIDNGTPSDPTSCPIARAIKRRYPQLDYVLVEGESATLGDDFTDNETFWLPGIAIRFIEDFDARKPVEPFEFELEPDESWFDENE
jgi:hypothetical protein